MAALAADRKYRTRSQGRTNALGLLANAIAYQGGLVSSDANGWGIASTTTAGTRVQGLCLAKADATGAANGAVIAQIATGVHYLDNDVTNPITQVDVGRPCFVKDDHTVQTAAGGATVMAGRVEAFDAGGVWVNLDTAIGLIGGLDTPTVLDNSTSPGIPGVETFLIPDMASGDVDIIMKAKFEVTEVIVRKDGAGAANTVQIKNGATAITDAMAAAVDKTLTRAATIDKAQNVIAIGGTLRCSVVRAAGVMNALVTVTGIRRA